MACAPVSARIEIWSAAAPARPETGRAQPKLVERLLARRVEDCPRRSGPRDAGGQGKHERALANAGRSTHSTTEPATQATDREHGPAHRSRSQALGVPPESSRQPLGAGQAEQSGVPFFAGASRVAGVSTSVFHNPHDRHWPPSAGSPRPVVADVAALRPRHAYSASTGVLPRR
jgi:hypothetical protein